MSTRIPSRRLGQSALAALRTPRSSTTYWAPSASLPLTTRRNINIPNPFKRKPDPNADLSNPALEEYFGKQEELLETGKELSRPMPKTGAMSEHPSSLFLPENEIPGWRDDLPEEERQRLKAIKDESLKQRKEQREQYLKRHILDPAPHLRKRMERKLVIESVTKHGRMSKERKIMRTERQSLYKSPTLPTSVKKLTKIMNQIAGMTVSDALVQLRFSKKRVARDVYKGLLIARDEASAGRGMGLGPAATQMADGTDKETKFDKNSTLIELKDGTRKLVNDPTEIYIDQAWVGRGEQYHSLLPRARGQSNLLTHRTTSFSVLLKEEKTRMRISDEIKKKRDNRKLWVALPDRPVTAQRQFCLW